MLFAFPLPFQRERKRKRKTNGALHGIMHMHVHGTGFIPQQLIKGRGNSQYSATMSKKAGQICGLPCRRGRLHKWWNSATNVCATPPSFCLYQKRKKATGNNGTIIHVSKPNDPMIWWQKKGRKKLRCLRFIEKSSLSVKQCCHKVTLLKHLKTGVSNLKGMPTFCVTEFKGNTQ